MRNLTLYDLTRNAVRGGLKGATDALLVNDNVYLVIEKLVYQTNINGFTPFCVCDKHECLTDLSFMVLEQKLWFGTGKAFVYYCPISKTIDAIESHEEFCAAVWSPSQEMLVVVSVHGQVVVYSVDNILKQLIRLGSCHISDPITIISTSVGWGSIDTQFRGSEGKLPPSTEANGMVNEVEDKTPRIIWRDDEEYFLINYWTAGKRMFKVFQPPCVPVYVSEDTLGLQAPTSWRCTANMIACPVSTDKIRIKIFERNGLPRHSFDLRDQIQVVDLKWNSTGEILAVYQSDEQQSYLSLYKMSNYHWYLKQRLDFIKENPLTSFKWVNRSDSVFELIVSTTKEILVYQFIYEVFRSLKYDSHGTCTVVDGNKLLIYNFAYGLIAPPDANQIIELKNPVTHVLFNSAECELFIIDCKYHCYLFSFGEEKQFVNVEERDLEVPAEFGQYPHNMHHFYWKTDGSLLGIATCVDTDQVDVLLKYDCNLKLIEKEEVQPKINYIELLNYNNCFLMLCAGGKISLSDLTFLKPFSPSLLLHLVPYTCASKLLLFSLNLTNQFYIDDVCVAEGVTSFLIYSNYLYVTTQDRLYCLRLTVKELEAAMSLGLVENCYSREMEKGAVLISGIPRNTGIILQMPRGNTEVNSCRIVAIDKLDALLDQGMWADICELFRTERLNTNLLVDLNPNRFFQLLPKFLVNALSVNMILSFVIDLVDENVLETKYKICTYEFSRSITDKKKSVCRAIISCINDIDLITLVRVITIASAHAEGIDRAMEYLREMHFSDREENVHTVLKGLDCLKLYFTQEAICASALSTYDTDFALLAYLHSTIDPKVYKPLLKEFDSSADETQKRFKINDYLGLYRDAMHYLARDISRIHFSEGNYDPNNIKLLIHYAQKHSLLSELYEMGVTTGLFFKDISEAYASHLRLKKSHKEAAIVYTGAEFYKEALEQYKLCNQWKEAVTILEKINVNETRKLVHIADIAKRLENCENYKDASFLYEVYLKDCELAVGALVEGNLFTDAIRVAQKFGRTDLTETMIEPASKEFIENVFKKLNSSHANFNKSKSRLKIVRQKKIELFLASEENPDEVGDIDNAGNQSAASVSSRSTRSIRSRTSTSTRSRRKEELKKQNTREGGYYEDIALMRSLHQLITDIFALGPDVGDMCHLLLLFKTPKTAKDLQNLLENVQTDMVQNLAAIWPENLNSFTAATTPELLALRENLEFLEVQYRCPPKVPCKPWQLNF